MVYQDAVCDNAVKVDTSGAGASDSGSAGSSYYKREGARLEAQEKAQAAAQARGNRMQEAILRREVVRGMTAEEVRRSWGEPTKINASMGSYGRHEQWVYDRGGFRSQYVYLENGVVTSMQSPQ